MSEYSKGFKDGWDAARDDTKRGRDIQQLYLEQIGPIERYPEVSTKPKRKRKLSAWQKYVKVNSKKPRFKYKSGSKRGRVNFKALGVAFRKTPAGKKKRR